MYEQEEKKLNELRERLQSAPLPLDKADGAILTGMERAKRDIRKKRSRRIRSLWTAAACALLFLAFVTSVRVSPAFANSVAAIPGMERLIDLIQNDKGMTAAIENDYFQPIGATETNNGQTLTIDGVILDESGMSLFYTIRSEESLEAIEVRAVSLGHEKEVLPSSISYGHPHDGKSADVYQDRIDFHFEAPTKFEDLSFNLNVTTLNQETETAFSIPFTVPENVKPGLRYELNRPVAIQGQAFTIKEVTIFPLRTEVKVAIDPNNSMEILQFLDMRLENEQGEVWGSILNGISGTETSEWDKTYYLQSNYFEKPEKLSLRIDSVQAVGQNEREVIVDTASGELLQSPSDGSLSLTETGDDFLRFTVDGIREEDHQYELFSSVQDAKGKEVAVSWSSTHVAEGAQHVEIKLETDRYTNPLQLKLFAYPNTLTEKIKIPLQLTEN